MHLSDRGVSRPVHGIVPPHLLLHLARYGDPALRSVAEQALRSLIISERLRGAREAIGAIAPRVATPPGTLRRTIYDAQHGDRLPGLRVRGEDDAVPEDISVNESFDGLGATYAFFADVCKRNSIDGRGLRLDASVHYHTHYDNAFWDGRQMVFGDGDGVIFARFTRALDVIGHELAHGVTQYEAALEYSGQPGSLNEHFSDVFGSLVKQYHAGQTAARADWLIGAGLFASGVKGVALRSMKAPGTAYDDPRIGRDPQPAHMKDYDDTRDDNGGVHINSGIPNHAFYLAAIGFGGQAWTRAGMIWYEALTTTLGPDSDFATAAAATVTIAGHQFGVAAARIVREAWKEVGVAAVARPRAAGPGGTSHAHSRGAERRRGGTAARTRG